MKRLQIIRFIILLPAIRAVYPALCSQFILALLGSSIVSAIAAEELTAFANTLNSQTFRSFEIYGIVTVLYIADGLRLSRHLRRHPRRRLSPSGARTIDAQGFRQQRSLVPDPGRALDDRAVAAWPSSGGGFFGLVLAVARIAPWRWLRVVTSAWIQVVQATPMLMLLLLFYFGINMFGFRIDAWTAAVHLLHHRNERLSRRDLARLHPGRAEGPVGGARRRWRWTSSARWR